MELMAEAELLTLKVNLRAVNYFKQVVGRQQFAGAHGRL